jgi:hypothetical protein
MLGAKVLGAFRFTAYTAGWCVFVGSLNEQDDWCLFYLALLFALAIVCQVMLGA